MNLDYLNEIGLGEAIRQRLQQLEKTKKYEIAFSLNGVSRGLDLKKQAILFYIFQEAVNNINSHAHAKKITVSVNYQEDSLSLYIKDNGIGIPANNDATKLNEKGSGLLNMKNHAAMIDGKLTIKSENGKGTEIILNVPHPYPKRGN